MAPAASRFWFMMIRLYLRKVCFFVYLVNRSRIDTQQLLVRFILHSFAKTVIRGTCGLGLINDPT